MTSSSSRWQRGAGLVAGGAGGAAARRALDVARPQWRQHVFGPVGSPSGDVLRVFSSLLIGSVGL
jgi:hypothetical protein